MVSPSSFSSSQYNQTSSQSHTIEILVYNCPWVQGDTRKSITARSNVNPWQRLKVVAYTKRRGNCFRCIIHEQNRGWNSNMILGRWYILLLRSSYILVWTNSTSIIFSKSFFITTLAFLTRPFSSEWFLIKIQIADSFKRSSYYGTAGSWISWRNSGVEIWPWRLEFDVPWSIVSILSPSWILL